MDRPRLKRVFPPLAITPGELSLGFPGTPFSATVDDPDAHLYRLAGLMDGSRTLDELCQDLSEHIPEGDVRSAVAALVDNGYVEDAALSPPAELSDAELSKYARNLDFFSFFSTPTFDRFQAQVALKNARVSVLGVGGLGSNVALHLVGLGVGRLTLIDFDSVEESNLNRQLLFNEGDLGRLKVEAAAEHLRATNSLVEIKTVNQRIAGPEDAITCFEDCDLLICAADRPRVELDRWLNMASIRTGKHWLRGSSVGLTAVLAFYDPGHTGCLECRLAQLEPESSGAADVAQQLSSIGGEATVTPCIAPVAGLLGALTGLEALKILTGMANSSLTGGRLIVDLVNLRIEYVENKRSVDCHACGDEALTNAKAML